MSEQENIKDLIAALVEQVRSMATRIAGNPERETQCPFCEAPLPLWENLLVLQLTGVAAHVECPKEALESKLASVGPAPEFPYAEFSAAVDARLKEPPQLSCSGIIEVPDKL